MQRNLIDATNDGPHGRVTRSIDRLPVVRGSPRGAINIYEIGFVAHAVRLDQIGHVRLVQHPDPGDLRVVRHPDAAYPVVARGCDLPGAPRAMTFP